LKKTPCRYKVNLPETVTLTDLYRDANVIAKLVTLDRETANFRIDQQWWNVKGVSAERLKKEVDFHWKWKVLISKIQNDPYAKCKGVVLEDGSIQGAMIYRVDAKSTLEPGKKAVYIDRLAVAPQNRNDLIGNPCYRGTGTGLLTFALCQSYLLGFQTRVNLFAAGSEQFYTDRGFVRTRVVHEEMPLYEIPTGVAMKQLTQKGILS
jgi:hypothetical protein